jgi:starch-binding outer membrane protein, SusD/RagB family
MNRILITILLAGLTVMTGCKKYIDLEPKDSTYDAVFWTSGVNVEKALAGAYGLFRQSVRTESSHFIFGDLPTGDFSLGGDFWNYTTFVPSGNQRFSYAPYLESVVQDWSRFYSVVNQCHLIVENAQKIPASKYPASGKPKNQMIGEAMFMRAYTYFYMTRIWGGVIMTTESLKDPLNVPQLGRSTETEVLDYCLQDLKTASPLLEMGGDKSYASKGSAWGLMAHIYAWKKDYANAEKYADSVINSGLYSLVGVDNYTDIWKGNSEESIFELNMKYSAQQNEANGSFFGRFLHDPYIQGKGANSSWQISDDAYYGLFDDPDDIRAQKIIGNVTSGDFTLLKYATVNYYDANSPWLYVVDNNLVLLRLADIYLLKAEAAFKRGNEATARSFTNQVKARAGIAATSETGTALWDEILTERRRELIGEGCNFYDIIRMGSLTAYFGFYSQERIDKKGYNWPLNMRTLMPQAPLLTQNEWWKNH